MKDRSKRLGCMKSLYIRTNLWLVDVWWELRSYCGIGSGMGLKRASKKLEEVELAFDLQNTKGFYPQWATLVLWTALDFEWHFKPTNISSFDDNFSEHIWVPVGLDEPLNLIKGKFFFEKSQKVLPSWFYFHTMY